MKLWTDLGPKGRNIKSIQKQKYRNTWLFSICILLFFQSQLPAWPTTVPPSLSLSQQLKIVKVSKEILFNHIWLLQTNHIIFLICIWTCIICRSCASGIRARPSSNHKRPLSWPYTALASASPTYRAAVVAPWAHLYNQNLQEQPRGPAHVVPTQSGTLDRARQGCNWDVLK